jgi:dTDP-4-dehydrorhamnose 3,5-epimerase
MASLADRGIEPSVVADQYGRLTFTDELAAAIRHLVASDATYGTYNLSNDGPATSWADLARAVFVARGRPATAVRDVSTEEYGAGKALAPRPRHSMLDLTKIKEAGYRPAPAADRLQAYLADLAQPAHLAV